MSIPIWGLKLSLLFIKANNSKTKPAPLSCSSGLTERFPLFQYTGESNAMFVVLDPVKYNETKLRYWSSWPVLYETKLVWTFKIAHWVKKLQYDTKNLLVDNTFLLFIELRFVHWIFLRAFKAKYRALYPSSKCNFFELSVIWVEVTKISCCITRTESSVISGRELVLSKIALHG